MRLFFLILRRIKVWFTSFIMLCMLVLCTCKNFFMYMYHFSINFPAASRTWLSLWTLNSEYPRLLCVLHNFDRSRNRARPHSLALVIFYVEHIRDAVMLNVASELSNSLVRSRVLQKKKRIKIIFSLALDFAAWFCRKYSHTVYSVTSVTCDLYTREYFWRSNRNSSLKNHDREKRDFC